MVISDSVSEQFHRAAANVGRYQTALLCEAFAAMAGRRPSQELRSAFAQVVWNCGGNVVDVLVREFHQRAI